MEQTQIDQVEQTDVDKTIELKAMVNMLRRAEGFTLAFVQCNYPIDRINIVAELRQILDDYPIAEIEFDKPIENLLDELIPFLPKYNDSKALFIYGLERSINPDNKSHHTVANLNISRNLFPKYVSCPMIIWLPAYAISAILRGAPDFFSWRSAIFSFHSRPDKISAISQDMLAGENYASASLTLKEKEERIEAIRNLIDEYQSLPSTKANKREQGSLFKRLGVIYFSMGQSIKAIEYYQKALEIARDIGDKRGEGANLGNLGPAYAELGQINKAIEYFQQALEIARDIGDKRGEGVDLGNLGLAYNRLGQIDKAIEYFQKALVIARDIGNRSGEGNNLGNLGSAYDDLGQIDKAIEYYQKALEIARDIGDKRGEGNHLDNLGWAYNSLGQINKAIEYHQKSLVIFRDIGDRIGEGNNLGNLGLAYNSLGQINKAIEYYQKSLVIARDIGNRSGEGVDLGNLGSAYANLGQINKAIEYYQQALVIAREIKDPYIESVVLENLEKLKQEKQSS
jgi:tetratricopeptide (TPR) repeat protein